MKSRSHRLARLALALLAVAGFVAPLAEREADQVVQTAGSGQVAIATAPGPVVVSVERREWKNLELPVERALTGERRFLLNRAWLL